MRFSRTQKLTKEEIKAIFKASYEVYSEDNKLLGCIKSVGAEHFFESVSKAIFLAEDLQNIQDKIAELDQVYHDLVDFTTEDSFNREH